MTGSIVFLSGLRRHGSLMAGLSGGGWSYCSCHCLFWNAGPRERDWHRHQVAHGTRQPWSQTGAIWSSLWPGFPPARCQTSLGLRPIVGPTAECVYLGHAEDRSIHGTPGRGPRSSSRSNNLLPQAKMLWLGLDSNYRTASCHLHSQSLTPFPYL